MSIPLLQQKYSEEIIKNVSERLDVKNPMSVPRLTKIVINICIGSANTERTKALEEAVSTLTAITGQKPINTKAKKSISNFKLREGNEIGTKVTLRGKMMYDFLLRFLYAAVPTIRDFRGLPTKSFDGSGNYTIGITDHTIFPEIDLDKTTRHLGMDITFVTTATNNKEAKILLEEFGFPFRKEKKETTEEPQSSANAQPELATA